MNRRSPWLRRCSGLALGLVGLCAGCGPGGEVQLIQPQLTGWQRQVHLATEQATWSSEQGWERVLVEFPLPGARTGRPTYILYLRVPADTERAAFDAAASPRSRGFLIQARGEYAGLALITGGEARVSGGSQAPRALRTLKLDLLCEDGTHIVGQIRARRDDWYVSKFETQRRPADVQALKEPKPAPTSQPPPPGS